MEGRKVEIARCRFWCISVCHLYEHLSYRILTDSPKCILLNSVNQVMSQITFEKVNAWSRNFFYIVNKRASFALHAHSLKVQNWSSALITRKITQVHSDCQKIACVASVSNWVTARKLERKQKKWKGEDVGRKGNACPQTKKVHDSGKRPLKFHGSFLL